MHVAAADFLAKIGSERRRHRTNEIRPNDFLIFGRSTPISFPHDPGRRLFGPIFSLQTRFPKIIFFHLWQQELVITSEMR